MKKTILRFELAFIFMLSCLALKGYGQEVPSAPTEVHIDQDHNLLMVKRPNDISRPYIIKGVSWSPASRAPLEGPNPLGPDQPLVQYGFFFDWPGRNPSGSEVLNHWLKNQILENYLTDLALIRNLNANTLRILSSLGSSVEDYSRTVPEMLKVLDECYKNNLMVIMTVVISKNDLDSGKYLEVVNSYKDHPAILMWAIGNEWNIHRLFGAWTIAEASAAVNQAAQTIKGIDPHHPVSSILAPSFNDPDIVGSPSAGRLKEIIPLCPNIDLWGLNVYRGASFGALFQEWQELWERDIQQPARPFYLSEFGVDSFFTTSYNSEGSCQLRARDVSGVNDYLGQAEINQNLWREINGHLPLEFPGELCLGGLIHEFNDSLWKVGNFHVCLGGLVNYDGPDNIPQTPDDDHSYDDYNNEGFVLFGAAVDNVLNEERFGLVDADRQPKLAYQRMSEEWSEPSVISISITNPLNNSLVRQTFSIEAEAKSGQAIEKVEFYLDEQTSPFFVDDTYPYGAILNTIDISDGQHVIKANVYDQLNNSAVDEVNIIVDNAPPVPPQEEIKLEASILREHRCSLAIKLKATSSFQPEAKLGYRIIGPDGELIKAGRLPFRKHEKYYSRILPGLPIAPYTVEVESDQGAKASTHIGAYHSPQDELTVSVSSRRSWFWFYPKRSGVVIEALSTQQPQACLRYKILNAQNMTVKKAKLWFHRARGKYLISPPDEPFEPLYLPKGNYKLVVESTHAGRREVDFRVE